MYNGDTLFYNYGKIDYITPTKLGVVTGSGIPGESGSLLIHVENDQEYTVYGALHLSHCRITNWIYHTFFSIISDDLNVGEPIGNTKGIIYPNPANDIIQFSGINPENIRGIQNSIGQNTTGWRQESSHINIEKLMLGVYFLLLESEHGIRALRFVKQ